jgi:hypothetical protein
VSLLTSARRSLYPLVGAGIVRVHLGVFVVVWAGVVIYGRAVSFVGRRHRLWAGVIVCGRASSFFGWLWWSGGRRWSLALGVVSCMSLTASMGWGCGGCPEAM